MQVYVTVILVIYNDSWTVELKIYLCHRGTAISKFSVMGLWNNTGARRLHQVSVTEPRTLRPAPLFAALPGAAFLF